MVDIDKLKASIARVKEITGVTEATTTSTTTETTTVAPIVEEEIATEEEPETH
jgi:hypothetical protein